jgi:hypothetical protein
MLRAAHELQNPSVATSSLLKELRVPNGQGVKKVAVEKAQLGAFRAKAAEEQETAALSARHEHEPLPTDAPNNAPRMTSEAGEAGISASGKFLEARRNRSEQATM